MTEILQDPHPLPKKASVNFAIAPLGSALTWTIGINSYPAMGQPIRYKYFVDQELTFTATVTQPSGVTIIEYLWDFGDQTEGYGLVVKHVFRAVNPSARISLQITDNFGRKSYTGQTVPFERGTTISPNPNVLVLTP